ncbi:MAG: class I SAM-dependent methyltransferase [Roseiflexaceae bacterium]|nr:class I SAM-dependent methyltransferase [Roseiflexaceae bacterium]
MISVATEYRRAGREPRAPDSVCYVCPRCHDTLALEHGELVCAACAGRYRLADAAYVDFAGPGLDFDDWWMQTPELQAQWLATKAPREEEFQLGGAQRYTLPLLRRLGLAPGATVLSAACGLAADVQYFNDQGYNAWGIDLGSRILRWSERRCRVRLSRADLFALPFAEASFDYVQCLNVIEHIGTVGDTTTVTEDYEAQRIAAIGSLLRVVKPGGYLLLSGVNRTFPIDFFHLQHSGPLRLHSPWEQFSLNCHDYQKLADATGYAEWTRPLPLRGFFSWTHLRRRPLVRPILPLANWALGCMPDAFYGSPLSFFSVVLIRRKAI